MSTQDDTTKVQAEVATPAQPDNGNQIYQMRKVLGSEIKGLKKQVLQVQLQSLKVMQQSVDNFFKQQVQESKEQMVLQEEDMKAQMNSGTSDIQKEVAAPKKQTQNKAALRAVQAAQKSVNNALLAANKSIQQAEDILKKE